MCPAGFAPWAVEPEPALVAGLGAVAPVPDPDVDPDPDADVEPVLAPVGLLVVGTTLGTSVHALSKTIRFWLLCAGTSAAATENSMHSSSLLTMPKTKDRQESLASQLAWQALAVVMPVGWDSGVAEPEPLGTLPQVLRTWRGAADARLRRPLARRIVLVNEGMAAVIVDFLFRI